MTANEVPCPRCGAASGAPCINRLTGERYRSGASHIERTREADRMRGDAS